jgi:hypothetical protein
MSLFEICRPDPTLGCRAGALATGLARFGPLWSLGHDAEHQSMTTLRPFITASDMLLEINHPTIAIEIAPELAGHPRLLSM